MEHKMHKAERQLSDADTMAILKKGDHRPGRRRLPLCHPHQLHHRGR